MEIKGPSKEELLNNISCDMRLTRSFVKRIYGYSVSDPDFAETALLRLEEAGCVRAIEYYHAIASEYEEEYNQIMKEVSAWYTKRFNEEWERGVRNWGLKNTVPKKYSERQKSDLLEKLQRRKKSV